MNDNGFHQVGGAAMAIHASQHLAPSAVEAEAGKIMQSEFTGMFAAGLEHLVTSNIQDATSWSFSGNKARHVDAVDKAARRRKQRARRTAQQMARRRA